MKVLSLFDGISCGMVAFVKAGIPVENIAKELFRVVKQGDVVVWVVNDGTKNGSETGTSFRQALYFKEIGFNIHDTMIWYKDSCGLPDKIRYRSCFEYMFVFTKGKPNTFNPIADRKNKCFGDKLHGTIREADGHVRRKSNDNNGTTVAEYGVRFNVWEQATEKQNKTCHPAVYPLQLVSDHILSWSNEGDIVLDPFLGSGTTAIACVKNNRHYIGFEISEEYFDICCKRLDEVEGEQ